MIKQRRAFEEGHKRKFLVILDDTPECDRAVAYAARRAERSGGGLVMLFVIENSDFQQWFGVEKIMRAEAQEKGEAIINQFVDKMRHFAPKLEPEKIMREGNKAEEILKLIEEDEDIAILVLAASTEKEGPGPLVSSIISKDAATFPLPVTIVPGNLSDADVEAIA
jgi:nucleotide-binding universal stress UspA family protein